jgi:prenyltransferase beta subunit
MKHENNLDEIKEKLKNPETIRPDDSRVIIAEMQINALKELANKDNRIFSQLANSERWDVARCLTFWADALPAISHRLEKMGIQKTFNSEIVPMVISEHLSLGHSVDRKRVKEYIEGLKAVAPKQGFMQSDENPKRSLMSRMI